MSGFMLFAFCVTLQIIVSTQGQPINPSDAASLLPVAPKTENETLEAIVQDPVIQNAVQSVVGGGTLSGLVVKKSVVIIPANSPHAVLSQQEQVFTVPDVHLEDIRKNITETARASAESDRNEVAEVDEFGLAEVVTLDSKDDDSIAKSAQKSYGSSRQVQTNSKNDPIVNRDASYVTTVKAEDEAEDLPAIKLNETKLSEELISEKLELPGVIDEKISVPILAVLRPSAEDKEGVQGSIVALLPKLQEESTLKAEIDFLNENRNKITGKIESYVDASPLTFREDREGDRPIVEVEDGRTTSFFFISPTKNVNYDHVSTVGNEGSYKQDAFLGFRGANLLSTTEMIVAPSEDTRSIYSLSRDNGDYLLEAEPDMAVAEDIVFRPLFRFHQEQQAKSRLQRRGGAYRGGLSYSRRYPYDSYDSYNFYNDYEKPHRRYKPRYSYDDY